MRVSTGPLVYNGLVLPIGAAGARLAALFSNKLRRSLDARQAWEERWKEGSAKLGDRPVWFHVASVGEFEQAVPVMRALGKAYPELPLALTFLSPSGYSFARNARSGRVPSNIRFVDYLPLDTRKNIRICLELLHPRALVFVKFDLWPNLIWESSQRGIPVLLIDGTLSPSSRRNSLPGRFFYRGIYEKIDHIAAISEKDAERFRASCPDHAHIEVVGDTRFDRVIERAEAPFAEEPFVDGGPVILAGSTWPPDEERILEPLAESARRRPELRVVLAPHEPTPERVEELLLWARRNGMEATPWSGERRAGTRVVVIDKVGILAELYRTADVAYVGGGFSSGVHSVIEPAAAGVPVIFGPRHTNSLEAVELLEAGAGTCIGSKKEISEALELLLENEEMRRSMGEKAAAYVRSKAGATARCVEIISRYLCADDRGRSDR